MSDRLSSTRLNLQNVSHHFGEVEVVKHLSFTVAPGEIVVLVGPSGCGKTTLLNLISGYITPASGIIERKGIVRNVYQVNGLFPWLTVSENIAMGLRNMDEVKRKDEVNELLRLVHLEGFDQHYSHQLSGGMRQRVELARALAGDSDILLMDEPFSALDYQSRIYLRRELVRMLEARPRTVVFVTHDIEEAAQLADRVFVLTKRPATICHELRIHLPRPRGLTDPGVIDSFEEIFRDLGMPANGDHHETAIHT